MKRASKTNKKAKLCFVGLIIALLGLLVWRMVRPVEEVRWSGTFMNRPWTLVVQDRALTEGLRSAFDANISAMLTQLETRFLRADGIGLVAEFNASTSTVPAYVGVELWRVVNIAKRISQTTPACDITLAPLQDLWARVRAGQIAAPQDKPLQILLGETGMDRINAPAEGYIRKFRPEAKIDVASCAEGYAADRIEILMLENKIANFHAQVGGTVISRGSTAHSASVPLAYGPTNRPIATTRINTTSAQMTTRGRNDGFIHIDPRTGRPVVNSVHSVTVIAETALISATLATALYILGLSLIHI